MEWILALLIWLMMLGTMFLGLPLVVPVVLFFMGSGVILSGGRGVHR